MNARTKRSFSKKWESWWSYVLSPVINCIAIGTVEYIIKKEIKLLQRQFVLFMIYCSQCGGYGLEYGGYVLFLQRGPREFKDTRRVTSNCTCNLSSVEIAAGAAFLLDFSCISWSSSQKTSCSLLTEKIAINLLVRSASILSFHHLISQLLNFIVMSHS